MNTTVKKGPEVSKSNADSLASTIANALAIVLRHEANRSERGRWFIINVDCDDAVNMLAGFLDLPYNDFVLFFEEAGLFDIIPSSQASRICFNKDDMNVVKGGGETLLVKSPNRIRPRRMLCSR